MGFVYVMLVLYYQKQCAHKYEGGKSVYARSDILLSLSTSSEVEDRYVLSYTVKGSIHYLLYHLL